MICTQNSEHIKNVEIILAENYNNGEHQFLCNKYHSGAAIVPK